MKATEQHFPVVLVIILYKMILIFTSVDEILKCDHSNKSLPVIVYVTLYNVILVIYLTLH